MSAQGRNAQPPKTQRKGGQRKGAALVIIAFTMITLIGMVAFAYDVGHMFLVRAQLQTAVDAGALAASLKLKSSKDVNAAEQSAKEFIQLNSRRLFDFVCREESVTNGQLCTVVQIARCQQHSFDACVCS